MGWEGGEEPKVNGGLGSEDVVPNVKCGLPRRESGEDSKVDSGWRSALLAPDTKFVDFAPPNEAADRGESKENRELESPNSDNRLSL